MKMKTRKTNKLYGYSKTYYSSYMSINTHDKETSFVEMFELIEKNQYVYNILIDQTKSWQVNQLIQKL